MILAPSNRILKAGKIKYSQVVKTFSLLLDVMHLEEAFSKPVEVLTVLLTVLLFKIVTVLLIGTSIHLKEHYCVT